MDYEQMEARADSDFAARFFDDDSSMRKELTADDPVDDMKTGSFWDSSFTLDWGVRHLSIGDLEVISERGDVAYWIEDDLLFAPPLSVRSLLLSRQFMAMPGDDRGVLSVEQIKNPYPIPISVKVDMGYESSDSETSELSRYRHNMGGDVVLFLTEAWDRLYNFLQVFGSSVKDPTRQIVIPPSSCRSVIHFWDLLPTRRDAGNINNQATLLDGIDLLNRFAVLDLKSIVPEDGPCPLAE